MHIRTKQNLTTAYMYIGDPYFGLKLRRFVPDEFVPAVLDCYFWLVVGVFGFGARDEFRGQKVTDSFEFVSLEL